MDDGPFLADPHLGMCADILDDLETVRCANESRLRTLIDTGEHGFGLDLSHPDVAQLQKLVEALAAAEHQAVLNLQRAMRKHPLGTWVKAHNGVGEKQAARLLASIRDPYWNDLHNRPRTVRELYAFCGMNVLEHGAAGGVAPTRQRGVRVSWSPDARQRLWLIADKCIMVMSSPYREIYDKGRVKYADAVHQNECKQCGPKGKPALPGSPLSAGHQHARARRLIAKQIMKDLWHEAKDLHTAQVDRGSQMPAGGVG